MASITLTRLTEDDREQFILDNQLAFKYGAMEEFGERDNRLWHLFIRIFHRTERRSDLRDHILCPDHDL